MSTQVEQGVPDGYKFTEVGVIPEDWGVKSLLEIASKVSVGLVINPSSYFDERGTVPMLVGSTVTPNQINKSKANRITEESNRKIPASRLTAGDLVTVRVGEPGITAVIPPELDGSNCASMMIVRKKTTFCSTWLCFVMNSDLGISQIRDVQYGTAQKQFNISDAINFLYPFPKYEEQVAIAEALSEVDALITSLKKLITKKLAIKTAAIQQLLTGKKRLPPFDKVHIGYKKTELGEIPEDWEVNTVSSLFKITAGGDLRKSEYSSEQTQNSPFPIYSNSLSEMGLYGFCQTYDYDDNCLTITARGGIGHAEERSGKFCAIGRLLVLKPHNKMSCKFVSEYINQYLAFASESTGVPQLTAPQVGGYLIVVPSPDEQEGIAEVLAGIDKDILFIKKRLKKIQKLKQGMMQELLTGKTRLVAGTA